jgi:hypothetical protein
VRGVDVRAIRSSFAAMMSGDGLIGQRGSRSFMEHSTR